MSGFGEPWKSYEANDVGADGEWADVWDKHIGAICGPIDATVAERIVAIANACAGVTFKGDPNGAVRELVGVAEKIAGQNMIPMTLQRRLEAALMCFEVTE